MKDYLDMNNDQMATVGEIIFIKNGEGVLEIKEELLKWITDHTYANDNRMLIALDLYSAALFENDLSEIFPDNPSKHFSPNEKRKIVAYIGSIYEPLFNRFAPENSRIWPAASTFENKLANDEGFEAYLKQQNYFSLPALKNIMEPSD